MTARRPAGRQAGAVRRWRLSFQLTKCPPVHFRRGNVTQQPVNKQRFGARQLAGWMLLLIAFSYMVWMFAYPMAYSRPEQVLSYKILASSKNFNELSSVLGSLREQSPGISLGSSNSSRLKTLWVLARIPADTVERTRVLHLANRSILKGGCGHSGRVRPDAAVLAFQQRAGAGGRQSCAARLRHHAARAAPAAAGRARRFPGSMT